VFYLLLAQGTLKTQFPPINSEAESQREVKKIEKLIPLEG
jgi:hypothetical protein